ncbi:MerR family transcriptional regulator [Saccharibacillus sp. CPCC 101409]|uniref:MerR family transcriptional regulator n=1 Tax=Saccharibacillus sp. CPCC 101409 TaxID=3058041 RepID=UPI0026711C8F|nr:MerR family transcriptional regulator [Saccharibacillus sp. CPCC 101409]MDO3408145.1 MerR family transcriptional regulator [Saccharibacillus sp. CPCC 101409]
MRINEVCEMCGLTRKAVDYYERQRLIAPEHGENGYRNFGESDIGRLREISLLRGIRLSISEIRRMNVRRDMLEEIAAKRSELSDAGVWTFLPCAKPLSTP